MLDSNAGLRGYLNEQASWRHAVASEHPEDRRNLRAAETLTAWSTSLDRYEGDVRGLTVFCSGPHWSPSEGSGVAEFITQSTFRTTTGDDFDAWTDTVIELERAAIERERELLLEHCVSA